MDMIVWQQGGAEMDAHKFGAFVAKCRKERNMTQADLALKYKSPIKLLVDGNEG